MKVVQEDKRMAATKQIRFATKDDAAAILLNDAPFLAGHSTTIFSKKFY